KEMDEAPPPRRVDPCPIRRRRLVGAFGRCYTQGKIRIGAQEVEETPMEREEHEDAIEWCYWQEVYQRTRALLVAYQRVR
ncbi:MAG: hypothetical protein ACPLRW_09485, partial [Moorellales bacterium]